MSRLFSRFELFEKCSLKIAKHAHDRRTKAPNFPEGEVEFLCAWLYLLLIALSDSGVMKKNAASLAVPSVGRTGTATRLAHSGR